MRRKVRCEEAGEGRARIALRGAWRGAAAAAVMMTILGLGAARADEPPDLSRPLTLEELLRLAKERNHGLAQAQSRIDLARGSYTSSWSTYLPSLRGSAGFEHGHDHSTSKRVLGPAVQEEDGTTTSDGYSLSLDGTERLLDPPGWFRSQSSKHRLSASEHSFASAEDLLIWNVTTQYYEVVRQKKLLEVAEQAYTLAGEQLDRAQALYELGSVAKTDVLQAQVSRAASERDRIAAGNAVEQQRSLLAVYLALPVDSPIEVSPPEEITALESTTEEGTLVDQAMSERPDLAQAKAELSASGLDARAARWSRYPTLALSYSYRKFKSSADNEATTKLAQEDGSVSRNTAKYSFEPEGSSWSVGLGLSVPIFDGFLTKGSIQQAVANQRIQERALEQAKLDAALEVRQSLIAIKNANEEIRSAREGVSLAEESVRLQKALYEAGGGTLLQWNNAQVELTKARVSLVEAEVNLRLAQAGLDKATGSSE